MCAHPDQSNRRKNALRVEIIGKYIIRFFRAKPEIALFMNRTNHLLSS